MAAAGRSLLVAIVLAAVAVLAVPAGAEVAGVALERGTLTIRGGDGNDRIEVAASGKTVTIDDPDGLPAPTAPCQGGDGTIVTCPRGKVDEVVVDLGDGNDTFDGDGAVRFEVIGDKGDDEIDGGDSGDLIEGKLGDDEIDGSEGSDDILGGLDDDALFGKAGKDLLDGGPGKDSGDAGNGRDKCVGVEKEKGRTCESSQNG